MRAAKRAGALVALAMAFAAPAWAATSSEPDAIYGVGNLTLEPGMTLYLFRPRSGRDVEVGRMRVLDVKGGEVQLELLSGSSAMQSGDHLEVEASAPSDWKSFRE